MRTHPITMLICKYKTYIDNVEWHLKYNSEHLQDAEKGKLKQRIEDWREIIKDLKML